MSHTNPFILTSIAAGIALMAPACGSEDGANPPSKSGDSGVGAGGGGVSAMGGASSLGGADGSGGSPGSGSGGQTGGAAGANGTGGSTGSGGAGDAGGFASSGGGSVSTGGIANTGGTGSTGDAGNTGGTLGSGGTGGAGGASGTGGVSSFPCNGPGSRYATGSPDHLFGTGQTYQQNLFPDPVLGPPKGGGAGAGSLDVVSLGNGGYVVLEFDGNAIVDGPGPDFIVFENVFLPGGDPASPFAEIATVAVSDDGQTWTEFPCTATAYPWGSCAGWHPTFANPDANTIDPTDPAVAGGDAFDLSDIGVARARYVKVTDRADLTGTTAAFDLDAVSIHNAACP